MGSAHLRAGYEPFVGRALELARLHECADLADRGLPQLVVVEGDAGIGKTWLLDHFVADLGEFTVLSATVHPSESVVAFGLIDQLVSRCDRELVRKFPLLAYGPREASAPMAVGADLLGLIGELQRHGPLAVVVDDAQWSDRASAQSVGFLLRRLSTDRVLTVFATRTQVVDDAVRHYLGDHYFASTTIRLPGLSVRDVRELTALVNDNERPALTAAQLRAYTDGNPLWIRALLAEAAPPVSTVDADRPAVPRSLAPAVRSILGRLPPSTRRMVDALAVLNDRWPLAGVAQLASVDAPRDALAPAVDAGLIQWWPADPGKPVMMRHALLREAAYADVAPTRRAELHAAAAGMVDSSSAWLHRVAAARGADPVLAVELEAASAREAASAQHDIAARYMHWAADLSTTRAEYERRLLTACIHNALTSNPCWAVHMQADVKRCADAPPRSCALGLIALFGVGDLADAEHHLTATVGDRAPQPPGPIVATAAGALAALYVWQGRNEQAVAAAELALSTPGLPQRLADFVRVLRSVSRSRLHGIRAGLADLAHLPTQASSVQRPDLDSLSCRGALRTMLGDYSAAIADLSVVIRQQRSGVHIISGPIPSSYLAAAQYMLGHWSNAALNADQAVELQAISEQPEHFVLTRMVATFVPAARGEWDVARHHVDAARDFAARLGTPQDVKYAAIAAAVLGQARGDPAGMRAAMRAVEGEHSSVTHAWWHSWWSPLLVEALIGVGDADAAAAELRTLEGAAQQLEYFSDTVCRLSAMVARTCGETDGALDICQAGLRREQKPTLPLPRAMLEHEYGRLLLAAGQRRAARPWLASAEQRYAALSARPFAERAARDLRAAGANGTHTSHLLPSLTGREQQIGDFAVRGMTNREIADELYITVKTVEYHLSNVYAKLGITSRRELRTLLRH